MGSPVKKPIMIGIGYRKDFADLFLEGDDLRPDFIEVAPENWMGLGGYWKKIFAKAIERYPLFLHGLSLSIGSPDPLDPVLLRQIRDFIRDTGARIYSEHLSFSQCDNAHLYDLLPVPFTEDAVEHVSARIGRVQEYLGRRIAMEIVSYYTPVAAEMSELEFVNAVVDRADCDLLLDVNNIYVNAFNHNYDAREFIEGLPLDRVVYIHMAGHEQVADDLIIDTHGQAIIPDVFDLFAFTMGKIRRNIPVLLERDFNIPELSEMQKEMDHLRAIKHEALKNQELYAGH